jgi:hypothetical protein
MRRLAAVHILEAIERVDRYTDFEVIGEATCGCRGSDAATNS